MGLSQQLVDGIDLTTTNVNESAICDIYSIEFYSAIKKKKIVLFA